jgi:hypothetical protein
MTRMRTKVTEISFAPMLLGRHPSVKAMTTQAGETRLSQFATG